MADEEIILSVKVDGVDKAITSFKDLKTATKQAKDEQIDATLKYGEFSKQAIDASKKVAALKDKVEDLNDSTKSLKGSGVERAAEGFNQLGEGLRNLDFEKVKTGLVAMKSALAAVGIGLIVQLVSYLIENFDKLSQGSGILAKSLRLVGDIIDKIGDGINYLTDAIGLTNSALDKMGEKVVENANKAKEALQGQTHEYDNQIAAAKAAGKRTVELEKEKQQAIIDTNIALLKQTLEFMKAGGELDEAQKKLVREQIQAIKDARNQIAIIDTEDKKASLERHQEFLAKKKEADDKYFEAQKSIQEKLREYEVEDERMNAEKLARKQALEEEAIALSMQRSLDLSAYNKMMAEQEVADAEAAEKKKVEARKKTLDTSVSLTKQSLDSARALTDIYFNYSLNKNKADAEAQKKIKKRQFEINKAFTIANIVLETVLGGIKAISQNPPPNPIGIISAVLIGVAGTLATVKALTTKFEDGGGGGGSPGIGDVSGGSTAQAPAIPQPNNSVTSINKDGTVVKPEIEPTKVFVVESDITDKTKQVAKIEEGAKIG